LTPEAQQKFMLEQQKMQLELMAEQTRVMQELINQQKTMSSGSQQSNLR